MKNVLYTKYNSTRKPEYQLSTSIIEEDGVKYVAKKAMNPKAKAHLMSLPEKKALVEKIYKDMDVVSCEIKEDAAVFPFVEGKSLLRDINFKEDSVDDIVVKVKAAMEKTSQYNPEVCCEFEITDEFREYFGYYFDDTHPQAICPANLDGILGNFLEQDNGRLCSIDYEWIVDFPVPVRFLDYRALFYLYTENEKYLRFKASRVEFLEKFGFSESEHNLYFAMELTFQQEVRGKGMAYAYPEKCLKKTTTLKSLESEYDGIEGGKAGYDRLENEFYNSLERIKQLEDKGEENRKLKRRISSAFHALEQQQEYINELKRMIKNPVYGVRNILNGRVNRRIAVEECVLDENVLDERTREYREKYSYVRDPYKRDRSIYSRWIRQKEREESYDDSFSMNPLFTVLLQIENATDLDIKVSVDSVCNQIYDNWVLYVLVDEVDRARVQDIITKYSDKDIQIVSKTYDIENAAGEFITYLESGDVLRENALYEVAKEINKQPEIDFIYSDEDMALKRGQTRQNPFFKPGWSPDTLLSYWYTGHLAVYRKSIAVAIGGPNVDLAEAKEYDFTLRFTEKTQNIAHIEKVLYHRRKHYVIPQEVSERVQKAAIERRGLQAHLEPVKDMAQSRVVYELAQQPLVSIIIPSKDNFVILDACICSLYEKTTYPNFEVILVDNGSNEENKEKYQQLCDTHKMTYIYEEMKFNFSKMCNMGAKAAGGEYFVFLNDDMEILQPDWLERMIGHASQEHAGAVGAKLLYPNTDLIQHIGVVMYNDGPAHALTQYSDEMVYSFGRNRVEYNWLAVTAACMAVRADKFHAVEGFNENLLVAFNDVELCFKLLEAGYYNVVRNDVILYHHESISRGNDHLDAIKMARSLGEFEVLKLLHPKFKDGDMFYNKNLIPNNVSFECDFSTYLPENHLLKDVTVTDENFESSGNIMGSIDVVEESEDTIYICGWALIPGRLDNNDKEWQVFLKGTDNSYIVDTDKDYRPDVADAYLNELLIEFVGFKCIFKKDMLESGEYQLGVVGEDGCKMVEKTINITY